MHELSLCQSAVEIIQRQAEQHDVKRVTAVWLEIGALSCVEESAVRFSFEIVCHGTVAQGCDLHIVYKPAQAWCWDCSQVVEIHQHDAQCLPRAVLFLLPGDVAHQLKRVLHLLRGNAVHRVHNIVCVHMYPSSSR